MPTFLFPCFLTYLLQPKWFLQRGDAGAGDLRSRLLDHKGQLNAFCFELSGEDWGDWTVSQMLSPSNETPPSRARQSKVTCLIAALQPAQAAVAPQDALEGIEGEAQDVLTQLVKRASLCHYAAGYSLTFAFQRSETLRH